MYLDHFGLDVNLYQKSLQGVSLSNRRSDKLLRVSRCLHKKQKGTLGTQSHTRPMSVGHRAILRTIQLYTFGIFSNDSHELKPWC